MEPKKKVMLSRPKDQSLEAFKAWIMEMSIHLTGKSEDTISEDEWKEKWQKFWHKPD